MKSNFLTQLNSLTRLLNEISNCVIEEQRFTDRKQYAHETEVTFLEFSLRNHLTRKEVPPIEQERAVEFLKQHVKNPQVANLTTKEDNSLIN
ncbi:hypothetical protein CXF83_09915 [Shewanella sp. Choline-02u-19]|nr:hypothetical protein CXF84_00785 [Shewanella sp. Bg11-22]PKI27020.1 hypothetical protein CXF83_09915 [Shewanella sp. Choline-02u-19]